MRIVLAGRSLWVVLDAEQSQVAVAHAFQCRVVQIHVRELDFALRQLIRIGGKVVVVGRYLDFARLQLLHGMISAMVAEFQLIGLSPQSNSYELMPQANSEYRMPSSASKKKVHRIRAWLGVARTIGQEHSIRF